MSVWGLLGGKVAPTQGKLSRTADAQNSFVSLDQPMQLRTALGYATATLVPYRKNVNRVTVSTRNPAAIWERVLLPAKRYVSPEQARYFLRLRFPPRDVRRMNALSAKARQGTLSPEEDEELETYIRIGRLLGTLQSRARQVLKRSAGAS